jgi:hypothetical protein
LKKDHLIYGTGHYLSWRGEGVEKNINETEDAKLFKGKL